MKKRPEGRDRSRRSPPSSGRREAVYAVDYRGLTVPQAAELRASLREHDATFRVVKNTLTLRAAEQAGTEHSRTLVARARPR